jgi:hypothetical protein
MGLQQPISKLIPNGYVTNPVSHPTSTPLTGTFYVMISVTFECKENANWPFLLQVDVAGDWNGSTKTNIKINTK